MVHAHLAEERMEPVIHRCHWGIGGEVGADSSNHLSSNEPVCVGVGGTAKRSSSLFTPSYDCRCTNAILRKHICSLSSFDGSDTATRDGSFYKFHSFTGGGGVLRMLYIRFLPAAVALRFAAFKTLLPATPSPAICAPVVSSRVPKATAPCLIRGATVQKRPLNKLPNQCPLWTRAPIK